MELYINTHERCVLPALFAGTGIGFLLVIAMYVDSPRIELVGLPHSYRQYGRLLATRRDRVSEQEGVALL